MIDYAGPSSGRKKAYPGKSATSSSSPVRVTSSPDGALVPTSPSAPPTPFCVKKYVENFNKLGKEIYFVSKGVLRGRFIYPEVRTYLVVAQLCDKLSSQGWIDLFFDNGIPVYEFEVVEFYTYLAFVERDVATSKVHGVDIMFDKVKLGKILHIPLVGLIEYTWLEDTGCVLTSKFTEGKVIDVPPKEYKAEMPAFL